MEEEVIRKYDIDKKPRMLKAEEIECRVGTINGKGCSLLLYKDARVDMKILVVGGGGREHAIIKKLRENPEAFSTFFFIA